MKLQKKLGLLVLGIAAILQGLTILLTLTGLGVVVAILWIVAGVLLVLDM